MARIRSFTGCVFARKTGARFLATTAIATLVASCGRGGGGRGVFGVASGRGGGGFNGSIPALNFISLGALRQGYVAVGSDSRHQAVEIDASWAIDNPQAEALRNAGPASVYRNPDCRSAAPTNCTKPGPIVSSSCDFFQ